MSETNKDRADALVSLAEQLANLEANEREVVAAMERRLKVIPTPLASKPRKARKARKGKEKPAAGTGSVETA